MTILSHMAPDNNQVNALPDVPITLSVYYSLIYSYLYFGCLLWGNNYDAPLSKVVKSQNKAVRIIKDVPFMEPIYPHYVALRLLKLPDVVKVSTCLLFYEYVND